MYYIIVMMNTTIDFLNVKCHPVKAVPAMGK